MTWAAFYMGCCPNITMGQQLLPSCMGVAGYANSYISSAAMQSYLNDSFRPRQTIQ